MATSGNPLAPNPETDIDSDVIHGIPLRDLETGEVEVLDPEEEEEGFPDDMEPEGI